MICPLLPMFNKFVYYVSGLLITCLHKCFYCKTMLCQVNDKYIDIVQKQYNYCYIFQQKLVKGLLFTYRSEVEIIYQYFYSDLHPLFYNHIRLLLNIVRQLFSLLECTKKVIP